MANLYPFLAYVFVTNFTPGPNNILTMTNAMRYGVRRTMGFMAGVASGFALIMLACGLLNVVLARLLPQVRTWLNLLGAAYMIYLAVHIVRSGEMAGDERQQELSSFSAGFALQFVNLKVILYGVTVYGMFIAPAVHEPALVSLSAPLLAVVCFAATSTWALGGGLFRQTLRRHYRLFNWAMAALLVYTAIASLVAH